MSNYDTDQDKEDFSSDFDMEDQEPDNSGPLFSTNRQEAKKRDSTPVRTSTSRINDAEIDDLLRSVTTGTRQETGNQTYNKHKRSSLKSVDDKDLNDLRSLAFNTSENLDEQPWND